MRDVTTEINFNNLFKKYIRIIPFSIAGTILVFVFNMIYARMMGPKAYGAFAFWMSIMMIASMIACLGFSRAYARFIPIYSKEESHRKSSGMILSTTAIALAFTAVISVTSYFVLPDFFDVASHSHGLLKYGIWFLPLFVFMKIDMGLLKSYGFPGYASIPRKFVLYVIAILISFLFLDESSSLTGMYGAFSIAIGAILVILLQLFIIFRKVNHKNFFSRPQFAMKEWIGTSMPMLIMSSTFVLLMSSVPIIINFALGEHMTGLYFSALKITALISLPRLAFASISSKYVSVLHKDKNISKLQSLLNIANKIDFFSSLLVFLVVVIFGKYLLELLGKEYLSAYSLLVILGISYLITAAGGISAQMLNLTKHQKFNAILYFIAFIFNSCLCILLLKIMGITGAAISLLATRLLIRIVSSIYLKKALSINAFEWVHNWS